MKEMILGIILGVLAVVAMLSIPLLILTVGWII